VHPSVPAPHLHVPALHLTGRLPVAAVLLAVVYASAIAVALTAPGQHAVAGCAVLAGLVSRSVVRRRRSAPAAVSAATVAVDAVLPDEVPASAPAATA
jgi:cytochrome b561